MSSATLATASREGKTKLLSPLKGQANQLLVTFKNRATAFNAQKSQEVEGKGTLNASISAKLFRFLEAQGISTCFISEGAEPNQLIYETLTMLPIEIVVRNTALGSLPKRIPLFKEGEKLHRPIVEFFYKSDELNDPALPDDALLALNLLPAGISVKQLKHIALAVNDAFIALFTACTIECADYKLEIGINAEGILKIADELSPDNFRLRDASTGQVLDKDVFRLDLGDIATAYTTVENRLSQVLSGHPINLKTQEATTATPLISYFATVQVQYKANVLHPESRAVTEALQLHGFPTVQKVKAGKRFEIQLQATNRIQAQAYCEQMCESLLANLVIETYCLESLKPLQVASV
jgi:phosphoribosylaminoimidazole-succinocarboxamide synthase